MSMAINERLDPSRYDVAERTLLKIENVPVKWKDDVSGLFFTETFNNVRRAESEINRLISENGYASMTDWMDLLGIDWLEGDPDAGWHIECLYSCGNSWLEFSHTYSENKDDGLYFIVSPDLLPCSEMKECFG